MFGLAGNKTVTYRDYLVWTYTEPPTIRPLWFEKLDLIWSIEWAIKYWTISIWAAALYLIFIFVGRKWMENRKPYDLKSVLIWWNGALAIFSIWSFIRTVPELVQVLSTEHGLFRSVCVREYFNESSAFYGWLFMWSKIVELGDTVFIVLRKKPLIFLHWFHHITVLVAVWVSVFHFDPVSRWFGVVNLGVHSLMYTYYSLKAMGYWIPKWVSMTITFLQISQMILAVGLNLYAIYVKSTGVTCARSDEGIKIHFWLYFAYLVLFANYFYKAYLRPRKSLKGKVE
ncbi:putative fatty acid elongation protein 3 [Folsomia candida]|nr:putative fatty acid elongation protein 3 [Folsomia candida]